jgi:hypothetical protein
VTAQISNEGLKLNGVRNIKLIFKTTTANQFSINWIIIGKQNSTGLQGQPGAYFSPVAQQPSYELSLRTMNLQENVFNLKGQKISGYTFSHEKSIILRCDYNRTHFFVPGVYVCNR